MKSDEEILTPVLSMTVEDDGSLPGEHEEQEVEIPSSLLDTNIDTTDADDVQYEFREDGGKNIYNFYVNTCTILYIFIFYFYCLITIIRDLIG